MARSGGVGRSLAVRLRLPHPAYLITLALRAVSLWVLLRVALLLLGEAALSFGAGAFVVGTVSLLVVVEARRAREPLFHGLLAASPAWPGAIASMVALGSEVVMRLLLRLL